MNLDLFNSMNEEELFKLCKEHKIETFNIKTKKNYSKKTLISNLSKIISNSKSNLNIETKFKNCIKSCHNYLYSNGSIVGNDASNDIIRIFILKVISYLYSNNDNKQIILNKIENLKTNESYDRYLSYLENFSNLMNISDGNDDVNSNYEDYMDDVIKSKLLSLIFTEDHDYILKTRKENKNIFKIIEELDKIEINEKTIDEFSTISIYEYFNSNYEGKSTSKKLGQFFTPKKMINCILNNCNFINQVLEFDNPSIYDPCCGTAGLLCNLFKSCKNIKANNIYGTEVHNDTIKYALASLLLSTNSLFENLNKGCSLSNNKFLFENKKFDIIFTNPPFGTQLKYKEIKEKFNNNKQKNSKEDIKFDDVFPIDTNVGINLFIQLIIYLLNENGIACIILPDGELMNGKSSFKIREFIIKNCKILKIISFPQNAFEYTSIKTNVLILKKKNNDENNDNQKNVEFIEVLNLNNEAKLIGIKDLNDNLSFHFNDEINEELKEIEGIEYNELKEVCEFQNGKGIKKDTLINGEYPVIGGGQKPLGFHNEYNRNENTILCSSSGAYAGFISKYDKKVWASDCFSIIPKNNLLNNYYLYYFLKNIQENIYKLKTGLAQPHVYSKDLEKIKIPIPSLEVQTNIIKKCEFLTDFNKRLEENIKDLKECDKIEYDCFKRIIYNNQDKEIKTLGEICEINYGTRIVKKDIIDGEYPVYGGGDIVSNINKYNREGFNILISRFGMSKKCVRLINNKFYLNDSGLTLNINNKQIINEKYLGYYLYNNQEIIFNLSSGVAQKNLKIDKFNLMKIPIPSMEIQDKFINYCKNRNNNTYNTHIRTIEKTIEDNKKLMKELFNFQ